MSFWTRPRRRSARVVLLAAAVLAGFSAEPAAAQTLTGETFTGGEALGGTLTLTALNCNPDGQSSFNYQATGTATGPFGPGTFSEAGTVTVGPQVFDIGFKVGPLLALEATFTINSPQGVVTGQKRLTAPQPFSPPVDVFPFPPVATGELGLCEAPESGGAASSTLCYEARTPSGVDRGTSRIFFAGAKDAIFFESFTSDPTVTHCTGNAPRHDLSTGTGQLSGHSIHVNAKSEDGARAKGHFFIHFPDGSQARGAVTCHRVDGNEATVGGRVDRSSNPIHPVGSGFLIFVQDNGEGADDPPDGANFTDFASPPTSCPPFVTQHYIPIDGGNYTVRDG